MLALLLLLSRPNIPTGAATPSGLYVVDPNATGIEAGATFVIPAAQPVAGGGVFADAQAALPAPRLVIIDLFATWCPPCQQETPTLRSLDRAYREKGLLIIGISVQELRETVRGYAERYEIEYPILLDVDGALFRAALAGGLPTKILLDAEGRVLEVLPRPFTPEDGPGLIAPLLRAP